MKKLILTAACSALAALSGLAQGTVGFQNTVTTEFYTGTVSAGVLTGSAVVPASSTSIDVGLFVSSSAFNTISGGTLAGVVQMGTAAGQIAGSKSFTPAGVNTGDTDFYQVFAWDASYGATLAGLEACVAANGLFGASSAGVGNTVYGTVGNALAIVAGAAPPAPGPTLFNTSGNSFGKTLILSNTPEPATIAISGLGAAALLLFRRRK